MVTRLSLVFAGLALTSALANPAAVEQLAHGFLGREILPREQVLRELRIEWKNAPKEFVLPNQAALFAGLGQMDSPNYVFRAAHFLAELPKDPAILDLARASLRDQGSTLQALVAALSYVKTHDPVLFAAYFSARPYAELSGQIRSLFSESQPVTQMREEYHRELLTRFATWTPNVARGERHNPHTAEVRALGSALLPAILQTFPLGANKPLPLELVYLLGEISSPRAFNLALSEYMARPNLRSAITIGSSLNSENVQALFDNFADYEKELRELLPGIFDSKWKTVRDYSVADLKQALLNDLPAIVENCRQRSKPITG